MPPRNTSNKALDTSYNIPLRTSEICSERNDDDFSVLSTSSLCAAAWAPSGRRGRITLRQCRRRSLTIVTRTPCWRISPPPPNHAVTGGVTATFYRQMATSETPRHLRNYLFFGLHPQLWGLYYSEMESIKTKITLLYWKKEVENMIKGKRRQKRKIQLVNFDFLFELKI